MTVVLDSIRACSLLLGCVTHCATPVIAGRVLVRTLQAGPGLGLIQIEIITPGRVW
jgi:hypothetical protein